MGLLDDAIREHLELKRRRGADPDEVARQEEEALGDPRAEAAPVGDDVAVPIAQDAPFDEAAEEEEDFAAESPPPFDAEPGPLPPEEEPGAVAAGPWLEEEREPEPEPEPAPEPEPDAAASPADEDVLEETPEFLQETPEHDRLWFEQKPPRDFDFGG